MTKLWNSKMKRRICLGLIILLPLFALSLGTALFLNLLGLIGLFGGFAGGILFILLALIKSKQRKSHCLKAFTSLGFCIIGAIIISTVPLPETKDTGSDSSLEMEETENVNEATVLEDLVAENVESENDSNEVTPLPIPTETPEDSSETNPLPTPIEEPEEVEATPSVSEVYAPLTFHFIETGNSDAILLESQGHYALIDAGDRDDDAKVKAYLNQVGVQSLDYLILTHYHADHIGAADTVLRKFNVQTTLVPNGNADTQVYRDFVQALSDQGLAASVPLEGMVFKLGQADLTFYNTKGGHSNENNNSLVTLVTNGEDKALFTGDAEKEIETTLSIGKVNLLKVGHHGSNTSSSRAFIEQVQPDFAVIMVGQPNKYQHPSRETMETFKTLNIPIYRTDEQGTLRFISTGTGITTEHQPGSYQSGEEEDSSSTSTSSPITSSSSSSSPSSSINSTIEYKDDNPNGIYTQETDAPKEMFKNCTALREVYPDGVPQGHPAYDSKHDRDKDGFACER